MASALQNILHVSGAAHKLYSLNKMWYTAKHLNIRTQPESTGLNGNDPEPLIPKRNNMCIYIIHLYVTSPEQYAPKSNWKSRAAASQLTSRLHSPESDVAWYPEEDNVRCVEATNICWGTKEHEWAPITTHDASKANYPNSQQRCCHTGYLCLNIEWISKSKSPNVLVLLRGTTLTIGQQ